MTSRGRLLVSLAVRGTNESNPQCTELQIADDTSVRLSSFEVPVYTEDNVHVGQLTCSEKLHSDVQNVNVMPNIIVHNNYLIPADDLCKEPSDDTEHRQMKRAEEKNAKLENQQNNDPLVAELEKLIDTLSEQEEIHGKAHYFEEEIDHEENQYDVLEKELVQFTKAGTIRKRKLNQESSVARKARKKELQKEKHQVLLTCSCKKECLEKIDEERRYQINQCYWEQDWLGRKTFILNSISRSDVKRRTSGTDDFLKNSSFKYFFKNNVGEKQQVRKTFFLTTLGYKKPNDWPIQYFLKQSKDFFKKCVLPGPDQRGMRPSKKKISTTNIEEHIESYNPCISHYRREHAPNRRYLPSDINVLAMYNDYIKNLTDEKCSYEVYRKAVKRKNISFATLGNEECKLCEEFKLHNSAHDTDNLQPECEVCQNWSKHIDRATKSRELYKEDAEKPEEPQTRRVSVDLQKVIMLPRLDMFKKAIFTQRLIVYNESFVPLGSNKKSKPLAVLWHETLAGRSKENIASTFYAFFLENRDVQHFVLWLDNCAAQNKNWTFMCMLVYVVNSPQIAAKSITINYFEPGHSFMSADSFHHQVEQSLKKQKKTYDFTDFISAVQSCNSGKVATKVMNVSDFYEWQDILSQQKLRKQSPRVYLSDINQVIAERGKYTLGYNNATSSTCLELDLLQNKILKVGMKLPKPNTLPCGISKSRKDNLLKTLNGIIPHNRREFWELLPCSPEQSVCSNYYRYNEWIFLFWVTNLT